MELLETWFVPQVALGLLAFSVAVTLLTNWLAARLWQRSGTSTHSVITLAAHAVWVLMVFLGGILSARYIERIKPIARLEVAVSHSLKRTHLALNCVHCRKNKTQQRVVAVDGKTEAHYPICEECSSSHVIVEQPGALIELAVKTEDATVFVAPQLQFPWNNTPAVA